VPKRSRKISGFSPCAAGAFSWVFEGAWLQPPAPLPFLRRLGRAGLQARLRRSLPTLSSRGGLQADEGSAVCVSRDHRLRSGQAFRPSSTNPSALRRPGRAGLQARLRRSPTTLSSRGSLQADEGSAVCLSNEKVRGAPVPALSLSKGSALVWPNLGPRARPRLASKRRTRTWGTNH
jgi:hypothetical protein